MTLKKRKNGPRFQGDLLRMLCAGCSQKEAAAALGLSLNAVVRAVGSYRQSGALGARVSLHIGGGLWAQLETEAAARGVTPACLITGLIASAAGTFEGVWRSAGVDGARVWYPDGCPDWQEHTPGAAMPCHPLTRVYVLTDGERAGRFYTAGPGIEAGSCFRSSPETGLYPAIVAWRPAIIAPRVPRAACLRGEAAE